MKDYEKIKKNGSIKIVIVLTLITAIVILAGLAYARYITRLNGTTTADIAQWSFKVNGKTNENFVIDLATTRTGVTQEAEVEDGYIGPGTAGAFQLVLDATGSEASLKYDINMNVDYEHNTVFPKNLIFYTDATMQNAIYHTDNNINLNGFIGWNDGSKVHTKTIYWKWDYETGLTQNEINANDELDSYWMGKPITLSMNVTAKQVNENPTTGQYSVTFDANGGTLQGYGNSSQATKMVTYEETYGALPTPSREGYIFKGWNGKNLVPEISNINYSVHNYLNRTTSEFRNEDGINYIRINGNASTENIDTLWMIRNINKFKFLNEGTYTLSFDVRSKNANVSQYIDKYVDLGINNTLGKTGIFVNQIDESGFISTIENKFLFNNNGEWHHFSSKITIPYNINNVILAIGSDVPNLYGENSYIDIKNLQLEIGDTATTYEPYYITSSTEVVQNQNHTLTAIWEPISN